MRKKLAGTVVLAMVVAMFSGCGSTSTGTSAGADTDASAPTATADENGNYVVNGSFEESDFTGWVVTNIDDVTEELDIYDRDTDAYEGVQSLHFYSGSNDVHFTAEQTIEGLPDGTYTLTGHIQGDAAGDENAEVYFYAVANGETVRGDASLNGYVAWDTVELTGLSASDGTIKVGVNVSAAPGAWGTIDDITLVKE